MSSKAGPILALWVLSCPLRVWPAEAGDENWDNTFGVPGATPGTCVALTWAHRTLYAGGSFTQIGGTNANYIASWDGTNWSPLGVGVDGGYVGTIAAAGSDIYAGGFFTNAGGIPATNIAKWDGTNWSALGTGLEGWVRTLACVGTNLYAGGEITSAGGVAVTNIARWNGSAWSDGGINGSIATMATDGTNLYVGWGWGSVAKWDGISWSMLPDAGTGDLAALRMRGSELFLFALAAPPAESSTISTILRWTGTAWAHMASGEFLYYNCFDCFAFPRDMVIVGNDFYIAGGFHHGVAKWDGTNWSYLGSGVGVGYLPDPDPWAIASSGSDLFVSGAFGIAGGKPSRNIARWRIPHNLAVKRVAQNIELSWPATGSNLVLEAKSALDATNWAQVPQIPAIVNDQCVVSPGLADPQKFYRLRHK